MCGRENTGHIIDLEWCALDGGLMLTDESIGFIEESEISIPFFISQSSYYAEREKRSTHQCDASQIRSFRHGVTDSPDDSEGFDPM